MEEKLRKLYDLVCAINYPGDNDKHLSYYTEEAEELASEVLYDWIQMSNKNKN